MTIDVIMDELMKLHSEVNHMYRPFGNLEKMVDCDEPPKRENDFSIKFVKNGNPYTCYVESKDWTQIYPKDLKPALECFKSSDSEMLFYNSYLFFKRNINSGELIMQESMIC